MSKTAPASEPSLTAQLIAEFLGTMLILLFGDGVVAMVQLFGKQIPGEVVNGGFTNITLCWGLAVTLGVYLTAKISGAHLNPAVTIAVAAFRGFPWKKSRAIRRGASGRGVLRCGRSLLELSAAVQQGGSGSRPHRWSLHHFPNVSRYSHGRIA